MSNTFKGILLAGCTGVMWAVTTPTTKLMWAEGVQIPAAVLTRMVVVSVCLCVWLSVRHPEDLRVSYKDLLKLFLFSMLGPTGLYLGFMMSVVYLNPATALVLHYTFPVVTALCSSAVTGERPKRCDWLGAVLVTVGVACSVLTPEWKLDTSIDIRGILWGVAAVAGLASQTLLGRASFTKGGISNWAMFFYCHLFGTFWTSLYISLTGDWSCFSGLSGSAWVLILIPPVVVCLMGYSTYYKSLEYVSAPIASLMASVEIIGAVWITSALTRIPPTLPEIVGCLFIFSAIALISISRYLEERALHRSRDLS